MSEDSPQEETPESNAPRRRVDLTVDLAIVAVVLSIPFFVVSIPPIADLPQQAAQVRLFYETLDGQRPDLEILWAAPNKISYVVLAAFLSVLPPIDGARLAVAAMALLWIGAVFALARARGRPSYQAVLVAPLAFSHVLYMGFFNFLLGFPVFVLFFLFLTSGEKLSRTAQAASMFGICALLYWTHLLWLGVGLAWAAGHVLLRRFDVRRLTALALGALPVVVGAALWYPQLARRGWQTTSPYGPSPWQRLWPGDLADSALGGLRGGIEELYLVVLLLAAVVGLWQRRRRADEEPGVDRDLLLASLLFLALALFLPSKVDKAIFFATRWMPVAATLFFLAMPPLDLRASLRRWLALGLVVALGLSTASAWYGFESEELAGLDTALAAIPDDSAVIGLDFYRESSRFKWPPFLQMHAYSQLLHGGALSFSFVNHASSLVVRRQMEPDPWTYFLEWRPYKVQPTDWQYFDYALIGGLPGIERSLPGGQQLRPVTRGERWRLYRIEDLYRIEESGADRGTGAGPSPDARP